MQKKPLIGLTLAVALITLVIMGCSALTPTPEVKITSITPMSPGGKDTVVTITFESKNKVDAIITTEQDRLIGPGTNPVIINSDPIHYSFFISGETKATMYITYSTAGIALIAASVGGSPATMWLKFYGADAYGYNKTFSDSVSLSF
ncbi:hypothetical protein HZA73_04835 [candidate division TA06 bacterium]|nr:hypothetical protein [candidate division TA06 bacterium]